MGNDYVIWAIVFLAVAAALFVIEVFVPSGGLLGFFAATSLVAGLVLLFKVDTTLGLLGALVTVISVPFFLAMAIRIWPNTPIARLLTLKNEPRPGLGEHGVAGVSTDGATNALQGQRGKSLTDLRPVGTCLINGQRVECLAETGMIRSGKTVEVIWVDGMTVKVKEIAESASSA